MNTQIKHGQSGFTLIELIAVIVILGILAATALPRFVNLQNDAQLAAIQGAAAAMTSLSTMNYGASLIRGPGGASVIRLSAASAGAALTSSITGWDTNKFSISTDRSCNGSTAGAAGLVSLSYSGGTAQTTATATVICTG